MKDNPMFRHEDHPIWGELKFPLPMEEEGFRAACVGYKLKMAIEEINEQLFRHPLKYDDLPPEIDAKLEAMRDEFWKIINENGVADLFT